MDSGTKFYAHTLEGEPCEHWQILEAHLKNVAHLASSFALNYNAESWAYCAGLLHDIGKYQEQFQRRLRGNGISVEHSGAGAALAKMRDRINGLILAFVIAGHHSGLTNLILSGPEFPTPLKERLENNNLLIEKLLPLLPPEIRDYELPKLPDRFALTDHKSKVEARRSTEMWTRFVFSALIDADRLDTEAFINPHHAELRRTKFPPVQELNKALDLFLAQIAIKDKSSRIVNDARAEVLSLCREAAGDMPGFFSLTAPTGAGKTLSAMSFALRHAEKWNLRRVIAVIPYTSIIEQNAAIYRDALGFTNVIEHHSNLDTEQRRHELGEERTSLHDMATENWDAPIIVTTTVQFFESLFSNHPSQCRKLHNIAKSVVILDEVQTLPPGFLISIVEVLNELVAHYGCTIMLSTATPPALGQREGFTSGLRNVKPIIGDFAGLNSQLQRVSYSWPNPDSGAIDWQTLACEVSKHSQVLTIVHRREDARLFAEALKKTTASGSTIHLSALMCPAHRSDVLTRVRQMLESNLPCHLVSTQLVEAGVDVDFPVVYRSLGGLDSIVQASGRCNRAGLVEKGKVIVFRAPTLPPPGTPRRALEVTESLLREYSGKLDVSVLAIFDKYFRMLYAGEDLDKHQIQMNRQEFNFALVGHEFSLIEDGFSQPIIVPYDQALCYLEDVRRAGPTRENMRRLQRFTVNIYPDAFSKLQQAGALEQITEAVYVLTRPYYKQYDPVFGLVIRERVVPDPEALIA